MRKQSHFGRAVYVARQGAGLTLCALADRARLSQPGINRIENYARRPDADTLRALVACWPDRLTSARVLIEHLRDEVERAGQADGSITMRPASEPDHAAAAHGLRLIHQRAPEIAAHVDALIEDIARMVATDPARASAMLAADPSAETRSAAPQTAHAPTDYTRLRRAKYGASEVRKNGKPA